jgi:hypothetical protein
MSPLSQALHNKQAQTLDKAKLLLAQTGSRKAVGNRAKLYSWHALKVACNSKGKSCNPYEFGVKVGLGITLKGKLIVGTRSFPVNPYDGHTLHEQIEQSAILMYGLGCSLRRSTPTWATGAWTRTIRTLRSSTAAWTSCSRTRNVDCSSDVRSSSPSSDTLRPITASIVPTSRAHSNPRRAVRGRL